MTITLTPRCATCGQTETLVVSAEGLAKWKGGELIQNAFPELNPSQREILISQICGKCFDAMFAEDDEEFVYEESWADFDAAVLKGPQAPEVEDPSHYAVPTEDDPGF